MPISENTTLCSYSSELLSFNLVRFLEPELQRKLLAGESMPINRNEVNEQALKELI